MRQNRHISGPSDEDAHSLARVSANAGRIALAGLAGIAVALVGWRASGYDFDRRLFIADLKTTWYVVSALVGLLIFGVSLGLRRLNKHIDSKVRYLGSLDPLTGLPNRSRLSENLLGEHIAVLYMDLDHFKTVNDGLGHDVGDDVLRIVASRIRRVLRETDVVIRLGGDEFAVAVEGEDVEMVALAAAARIRAAVATPMRAGNREVALTASIGIAVKCAQLRAPGDLLRAADLALYRAKRQGRDQAVAFNSGMESNVVDQFDLEKDLWLALEHDELEVHYQPEISMESGRITGFEALVRWRHPHFGLLKPDRFIGLAEENGALNAIGMWVLEQACRQWRRWQELIPEEPPLSVSVNLSLRQFHQPDLGDRIAEIILATGMDPACLRLEIGESALMRDARASLLKLAQLKEIGVQIAVDDFGTAASGLNYLRQLPVQSVKIDQSFVQNLETDDANLLIIQAIVTLAHDLGLDVTAEGVETRQQLKFLQDLGCDRGQGYFLAEPLPTEMANYMLETYLRGKEVTAA